MKNFKFDKFGCIMLIIDCLLLVALIFTVCNFNKHNKKIDLYEHIDPDTGVHWYIYEDRMYPRVCEDGTYYTGGVILKGNYEGNVMNSSMNYIPVTKEVSRN